MKGFFDSIKIEPTLNKLGELGLPEERQLQLEVINKPYPLLPPEEKLDEINARMLITLKSTLPTLIEADLYPEHHAQFNQRVDVELEEDTRGAPAVMQRTSIARNAILIRSKWT